MPVLLLRATREMFPGTGFIVSTSVTAIAFRRWSRARTAVDIEANHYTIATSDAAATAIAGFLGPGMIP